MIYLNRALEDKEALKKDKSKSKSSYFIDCSELSPTRCQIPQFVSGYVNASICGISIAAGAHDICRRIFCKRFFLFQVSERSVRR